jgi:hypothetical protein
MATRASMRSAMRMENRTRYQSPFSTQIIALDPQCETSVLKSRFPSADAPRFLIRSKDKAVLHTGDVRADTVLLNSLRANPVLGEFDEPATHSAFPPSQVGWGKKTLDRIYLDTSAM